MLAGVFPKTDAPGSAAALIPEGTWVGVLGPGLADGAGRVLPRVGALIEGPAFYPFLNGHDNLARIDAADPRADPRTAAARISGALDRVGLRAAAGKRFRNYSLGMKQRLAIAGALPHTVVRQGARKTTRRYPRRFADEFVASGLDTADLAVFAAAWRARVTAPGQ